MNILNKVTLKGLMKNKTRTIVTVIGIILSAAMICAVTTFASSLRNMMLKTAEYETGSWYGKSEDLTAEEKDRVLALDGLTEKGIGQELGYSVFEGIQNEYKPYLKVLSGDEGFFGMAPIHLTAGRMPQNPGEVLIPEHLSENGGVYLREGDTLTLSLGSRVLAETGEELSPWVEYGSWGEEEIAVRKTAEYKVVGFYKRLDYQMERYSDPGYTLIGYLEPNDTSALYSVYFRTGNANKVFEFIKDNKIENSDTNTDYLMFLGASRYTSFSAVLYSLMAIVIGIIMLGSISLIYNAFSISVSERTKQFGLLSSIGATKKQMRSMVFSEAFFLSIVGIPLGILSGIAGIGVTLYFLRDTMVSMMGDAYKSGAVSLTLSVSWASVIAAAAIALATVLISAWIPSRRAKKVTAIEAIRQSADLKTKGKDVKVSKLTYKMFGLEGLIAKKHFKRNRKKYRSTVVSLSLSIILFVSASAFSKTLVSGVDTGFETCDYQIEYIYYSTYTADGTADKAFPAELFTQLKSAEHVTGASMMRPYIGYAAVLTEDLSEDYRSVLKENAAENAEKLGTSADPLAEKYTQIQIWTAFLDDESYDLFLSENGLSRADVEKDGTTKPLYYGKTSVFDYNQEKFLTYPVYSEKKVPDFTVYYPEGTAEEQGTYFKKLAYDKNGNILGGEYVTYDSEIGEEGEPFVRNSGKTIDFPEAVRVKNLPFCLSGPVYSSLEGVFILPKSAENGYFNGYNGLYSSRQTMAFRSDDTLASMKDMKDIFDQNHLSSSALSDLEENERSARSTVIFVNVFAYGFIVLISLISVANVFNTITTNMNLRRREFAMLKTVGLTRKGFKKMMNFECILYGVKSLVYGLPVAVFFAFLINRSMNFGVTLAFTLPWEAIGISVFSVFTVVFVSMLFSMSKINKDNPIDALRNENL